MAQWLRMVEQPRLLLARLREREKRKKKLGKPGIVVYGYNLRVQEAETGGLLSLRPARATLWNPV